jgi:hypothetical protein
MLLLSVLFRCNPIQHCTEATIMRASGLPRYCYDAIWKPRTYATLTHNALAHCVMWSGHICRCSQTHFVFTAFQLRSGKAEHDSCREIVVDLRPSRAWVPDGLQPDPEDRKRKSERAPVLKLQLLPCSAGSLLHKRTKLTRPICQRPNAPATPRNGSHRWREAGAGAARAPCSDRNDGAVASLQI